MKTQDIMKEVFRENQLGLLKSLSLIINDFARLVAREDEELVLRNTLQKLQLCCKTPDNKVSDFIFYCKRRPYREIVQIYEFMTKHEELHKGMVVLGDVILEIDRQVAQAKAI